MSDLWKVYWIQRELIKWWNAISICFVVISEVIAIYLAMDGRYKF